MRLPELFLFFTTLLVLINAQLPLRNPIDLIGLLKLNESSEVNVLYSKKVYTLISPASRPILDIDPQVNLTTIAFRISVRANYATHGTLLAITNPVTKEVLFKLEFSQSLYDLYYMKVKVHLPAGKTVTLNIESFDSSTWSNLVFILTPLHVFMYDTSDCLSGDSDSISDVVWPDNLEDYSLYFGTSGEAQSRTMTGIEVSELFFYSGPQAYTQLCRPFSSEPPLIDCPPGSLDSECNDIGSGSGDFSGEYSQTPPTTNPVPSSSKGEPGAPGNVGLIGPKGDRGDTTVVTQAGQKGSKGETGIAGINGTTGGKGERGNQGLPGKMGQKGEGVEWERVEEEIEDIIENSTLSVQSAYPTCDEVRSCLTNDTLRSMRGGKGEHGDRGQRGSKGEIGSTGLRGEVGPAGVTGEKGVRGDDGLRGDVGPPGREGRQGDQGVQGPPGEAVVGDSGENGERGEAGMEGRDGEVGQPGPPGPEGTPGPPGVVRDVIGSAGSNGSKGRPGVNGEMGDPGVKGDTGSSGPSGRMGDKGANGETGPAGVDGVGKVGEKGEPASLNLTDEYVRSAAGRLTDLLDLKGKKGADGESGVKGESGRQGFPGIPGPQGAKGPPGKTSNGTKVVHARSGEEMAAVSEAGSLVYRSDLGKMAFLSLDGWLEIRASITPWVEIVDVGSPSNPDSGSYCGDSVVDDDEECDSTNLNELTCKLLRGDLYEGELRCTPQCTLDFTGCQLSSIVIFGLSTPVSGRLEGTTGADNLCNRESITGYYKAFIHSFNRNPALLVPRRYHFLPVKNSLAQTMYNSWAELLLDNLFEDAEANLLTYSGDMITEPGYWVGERDNNCRNWNSQQASDTGLSSLKNTGGYARTPSTCNKVLPFICVLIAF